MRGKREERAKQLHFKELFSSCHCLPDLPWWLQSPAGTQGLPWDKELLWKAYGKSTSIAAAPRPSWSCGSRLAPGLRTAVPLLTAFLTLSPWHRAGKQRPGENTGLLPTECLCSGRNQEASELPASGVGFLTWFHLLFHKYEHRRAGGGIFWSEQQNGESSSLKRSLLQPPKCPTSKKEKKFYVYRGKGGMIYFHNKEKSTGCSPKLQIHFLKQ